MVQHKKRYIVAVFKKNDPFWEAIQALSCLGSHVLNHQAAVNVVKIVQLWLPSKPKTFLPSHITYSENKFLTAKPRPIEGSHSRFRKHNYVLFCSHGPPATHMLGSFIVQRLRLWQIALALPTYISPLVP